MTISIWRYSHLALAVSSFVFILIASLTGIVLTFEPISNQLKPFHIPEAKEQSIAKSIEVLNSNYEDIIEIKIDKNHFVLASVITHEGNNETFYINPINGKKLGNTIEKSKVFQFATNLHRSLFLKSTGRFFVALTSFLLFLIALSGFVLIIKRQGNLKKVFYKIVNESFYQYYHVYLGRLSLIPILIITLTGVYLSLEKFNLLPKNDVQHTIDFEMLSVTTNQHTTDIEIFKNINLKNVKRIEFPFSDDIEDYYTVELEHKELLIHQITGAIISEKHYPFHKLMLDYSLFLHTGRGSILWSIILLIATCSILFFMYSGFVMTLSRKKKGKLPKNIIKPDDAEYVLLIGSETGNTLNHSITFYNALRKHTKKIFITELNRYGTYKNAKHIIIITATYGEGEAPANANNFLQKLKKVNVHKNRLFSVVGFGSLAYPDFCQFAIDIDKVLQRSANFKQFLPLEKINNQSFTQFNKWANLWGQKERLQIALKPPLKIVPETKPFKVINRSSINDDQTFTIQLKPMQRVKFQSGDLLSFYPEEDGIERQYSIGKIGNSVLLSIKKHELGICSKFLSKLNSNSLVYAQIKPNKKFHFPTYAQKVVLISNGTGIAPFLGMLDNLRENVSIHLFWGGRTKKSFSLYKDTMKSSYFDNNHIHIYKAFSQEQQPKKYVQHLLQQESAFVAQALEEGTVFMICGSIAMQNDVLEVLKKICNEKLGRPLSEFELNDQFKMDCY